MSGRPESLHEMLRAGYVRKADGVCKGCNAPIAWFRTTHGASMPVNLPIANENVPVTPHWATCPKADDFKGPKRRQQHTAGERARLVQTLLESTGAQVMVAIYPEGGISAWMPGLDPEDTRDGIIAEANRIRFQLRIKGPADKEGQ